MEDAVVIDAILAARVDERGRLMPESMNGRRKMTALLRRRGLTVSKRRVDRLMRQLGIGGLVRGKRVRTTIPDRNAERAPDLLERDFTAEAPNRRWVASLHVCAHLGRVRLRGLRDRLLLPRDRRLARVDEQDDPAGDHRPADGALAT
nr:IS3 family transposase [Sediminivirga luteola]